jgi:hypothetical protein
MRSVRTLLFSCWVLCSVSAAAANAPLVGFWEGVILYQPAEIELEFALEIAPDAQGRLVGTIDLPTQRMRHHPLSVVAQDGRRVHLQFRRDSEARGADAPFDFEGELGADGTLAGTFVGFYHNGKNRFPFRLERRGDPGMERPQPEAPPLHAMAPAGDELAATFNRDGEAVRLVMLLSPT